MPAFAQSKPPAPPAQQQLPPSLAELQQRLNAAFSAQQSGDLAASVRANRALLAFALHQLASLRLAEGSPLQSVDLYKRSLDLEDAAETHIDLAIAYLRSNKPDDALAEAQKALYYQPNNARALNVQAKAWMMLKDYKSAARDLAHAISIKGDVESAYSLAICFLMLKQPDKAAMVFNDIVKNVGESGSIHILFGRAYRDSNLMDLATKEFQRALEVDPKTLHAHYFIGLIKLIENEWAPLPEIREQMLAELALNPKDYLANYVMGVFESGAKNYDESDKYLKLSVEQDPDSPECWIYMGLNAYGRRDLVKAEEYLRKSIALTKDESRSHFQIRKSYYALGRTLIETNRREEGEKWLKKARAIQQLGLNESAQTIAQTFAEKGVGMGAVADYVDKDKEAQRLGPSFFADPTAPLTAKDLVHLSPEEQKAALDQDKELRQILGSAYNDLGTSEARQKQYAEAAADFRQAEIWTPELPGVTRNLGLAAAKAGDHATAIRALSAQLIAHPDDTVVRAMLGLSLYFTNSYKDAATTIAPLGSAAIKDEGLAYAWAASLANTDQLKPAADVLTQMEQQPLSTDSLLLVGKLWSRLGDDTHAAAAFRQALQQDPSAPRAHYFAGMALLHAGRPQDAAAEFTAELQREPADNDSLYNLGYTYLMQSKPDDAMKLFEQVIAADPNYSDAQYQLGKLLLDQGKTKDAIAHLEAAARVAPEKDFIHLQLQNAYRKESRTADADRELALYKQTKARNRENSVPIPNQ